MPKPGEADTNHAAPWCEIRSSAADDPQRAAFVDRIAAKYKALSRPSIAHPNDSDYERAHAGRGGESRPYPDEDGN